MIYQRERRAFSLSILEILIVILLISIIGGVVGYNLKGSLEKGRAFKTEQAKEQLQDLLLLCVAEGKASMTQVVENPLHYLQQMDLAKKPDELIKDGWGIPFEIKMSKNGTDFEIKSKTYLNYKNKQEKKKDETIANEEKENE